MPPYRIEWLDEAKGDVRALDQPTSMRLFEGILRFSRTGSGDVNALHGDMAGAFRLRLGDYRVLFTLQDDTMRIFGVRHRSQAYRWTLQGVLCNLFLPAAAPCFSRFRMIDDR